MSAPVKNGSADQKLDSNANGNSNSDGILLNGQPSQEPHFDCVAIGAGMSGLSIAGRLKALGVSTVTLERNAQIGQN